MAGDNDCQASSGEAARRTRKGKMPQQAQIDEEATNGNETEYFDNEDEGGSESDNDDDQYDYCTLAKILETVPKLTSCNYYSWSTLIKANLRVVPHATQHLKGTYDKDHPKWNKTFDNALVGVLQSTLDTKGEYNVLYLLLDITLLTELNEAKMFHTDARKLIQEIRVMQTETSLLGAPFSNDALYAMLQRCTIQHPVYKETVATVHQVSFDALATALTTCQSAMESVPGQKVDPCQACARIAGGNEEQADDTESDTGSMKTTTKPKVIHCWEVWCSFTPSWQQLPKSEGTTCWILDSGASYHMVNDHSMLIHPRNCRKRVYTAGSEVLEATAVGDTNIATEYGDVYLQNVLYVKRLNINLLSTNSLMDEGARVTLDMTGRQIHLANGMLLRITKDHECGLLEFQGDTWRQSVMTTSTPLFEGVDEEFELANRRPKISTRQLWHEHLGHPGRDKSRVIADKLKGKPVAALDPDTALTCEQCMWSKSTATRMGQGSSETAMGPLDLIHIDLIIDSSHVTEYTCTLVLVDNHSNIQPPPVPTIEEELDDLGYTEENLFDEREQEPLEEYIDMELALEEEGRTTEEREEYALVPPEDRGPWPNWKLARNMCNPETWVKKSYFGLTVAKAKEGKDSLNPTVCKVLAGKDRRFWEEAMCKELDGLEAMGTWEMTDLPQGMNAVDTRWVLKIKTDADLVPTKYKARLVAWGFTQREGCHGPGCSRSRRVTGSYGRSTRRPSRYQ
ncbi:uncharacterized protein UHO2_05659 [Ustilago hordei]|uniref:uncharacterized protein n=1 Tax=Ustilago hordei TaxID=120017 RepID=UPI001A3DB2CC|nr:uncharacterized protein UHO2_05659 [Ustilago hordei]SYW76942.1 related to retrotransposon protein [Ustilago hordei]